MRLPYNGCANNGHSFSRATKLVLRISPVTRTRQFRVIEFRGEALLKTRILRENSRRKCRR